MSKFFANIISRVAIVVLSAGIGIVSISSYSYVNAALPGYGQETLAPMLEKATPAVVNIATEKIIRRRQRAYRSPFDDPFFRHFFSPRDKQSNNSPQRRGGIGSGVIIDAQKGYIITNHHVIDEADNIFVSLSDGRRYEAEVVGADPDTDIAVVAIEADDLIDIPLADSAKARVGDFVVAIGNPFRLGHTVTLGIVSALGRSGLGIESYEDFIQTDASINPGNSGGALVNLKGELLGINTAILGPNQSNIGIGFAIPSDMVRNVTGQLIEHGEVKRGRLGVVVQTLTPDLAQAFDLDRNKGVVITEVINDSSADEAGLEAGDIILSANNKEIISSADMRNYIGLLRVGSEVNLKIMRNDEILNLVASIVERQANLVKGYQLDDRLAGSTWALKKRKRSGGEKIIVIANVAPNSPAYFNDLRKNDVVLSINRQTVSDFDEVRKTIDSDLPLLLSLRRGNRTVFYALSP